MRGFVCNSNTAGPKLKFIPSRPFLACGHHAAYTFDNNSQAQTLYLNGVPVAAGTASLSIDYNSSPLFIGADSDYVSLGLELPFNGEINAVSIYDRALTSNEIAAIYNAGNAGKCAPTVTALPTLTITASNASMIYGGTVPALGFSYSGFVNGDTPASLTTAPTVSTTVTSLSHAGTYPITVTGAVDTNYNDCLSTRNTLTINPAPLTITASNGSKSYGQTASLPATAFGSVGLLNGDTITGVALNSGYAASDGGRRFPDTIVPRAHASGPRAGNYSITYSNGTLTVNPTLVDHHG